MTACFAYGKKIADTHLFSGNVKVDNPRAWNMGPLCVRCGICLGTIQFETASDFHRHKKGHVLGSYLCEVDCKDDFEQVWWEIEPWPLQHDSGCPMAAPTNHDHGCGCGLEES